MPHTISMRMPNGDKSAITVETLNDGCIGLGFIRPGQTSQAIKLPRTIAAQLAEAMVRELKGDA